MLYMYVVYCTCTCVPDVCYYCMFGFVCGGDLFFVL